VFPPNIYYTSTHTHTDTPTYTHQHAHTRRSHSIICPADASDLWIFAGFLEERKNVLCTSHLVQRIAMSLFLFLIHSLSLSLSLSLSFPFYFGPFVSRRGRLSGDTTPPSRGLLGKERVVPSSFAVRRGEKNILYYINFIRKIFVFR